MSLHTHIYIYTLYIAAGMRPTYEARSSPCTVGSSPFLMWELVVG